MLQGMVVTQGNSGQFKLGEPDKLHLTGNWAATERYKKGYSRQADLWAGR